MTNDVQTVENTITKVHLSLQLRWTNRICQNYFAHIDAEIKHSRNIFQLYQHLVMFLYVPIKKAIIFQTFYTQL